MRDIQTRFLRGGTVDLQHAQTNALNIKSHLPSGPVARERNPKWLRLFMSYLWEDYTLVSNEGFRIKAQW